MKNIFKIFFFLFSIFCFSQTQEQKIESILNVNKTIESYKDYLIEMKIKPLRFQDSTKIDQILKKLTDDEIKKRILKSFSETYSTEDIDKIYDFFSSSAGRNFISNYGTFDQKIKNNFKDIDDELQIISDKIYKKENEESSKKEKAILVPVNREDGFYEVLEYKDIVDLKTMKLAKNPTVKGNQIIEIKNVFNDLGMVVIDMKLNKEGAENFKKLTENNIGKPIAIVLNKTLISAPNVNEVIPEGRIQISGNFSLEEAEKFLKLKK